MDIAARTTAMKNPRFAEFIPATKEYVGKAASTAMKAAMIASRRGRYRSARTYTASGNMTWTSALITRITRGMGTPDRRWTAAVTLANPGWWCSAIGANGSHVAGSEPVVAMSLANVPSTAGSANSGACISRTGPSRVATASSAIPAR